MTFRITQAATVKGTLLRVDGRLDAESLSEFERCCKETLPPLTLDFEGVLWIDDEGTEFLRQLIADGTVVANASPFVALRLKIEREEMFSPRDEAGNR